MKKNNIAVILILAVSAVLFTSGVIRKIQHMTSGENQQKKAIAVIPKGTDSQWWQVVKKGALDAAKEEGYSVNWNGPKKETERDKQIQVVSDALARGDIALVLGPNDATALVGSVEKAKASGIPVVIIDSGIETDIYDSFAATDNYAGGADAARRLGKALNERGNVIVIRHVQNSASTDERAKGFRETIAKEFPDIRIIEEQHMIRGGSIEEARQTTTDLLIRNNDVDGVFAVNMPTSIGAYKAIDSLKLFDKIKFVGFDSDPVLLDGIENGEVEALIVQDPYKIGFIGVKTAIALLNNQPVEKLIPIPSMIVDKDNLEEQKQKNPAALGL